MSTSDLAVRAALGRSLASRRPYTRGRSQPIGQRLIDRIWRCAMSQKVRWVVILAFSAVLPAVIASPALAL